MCPKSLRFAQPNLANTITFGVCMTKQFHDVTLSADALDQIFNEARTYNGWLNKPVSDEQLHAIWDLTKMAPTSANMSNAD